MGATGRSADEVPSFGSGTGESPLEDGLSRVIFASDAVGDSLDPDTSTRGLSSCEFAGFLPFCGPTEWSFGSLRCSN